MSTATHSGSATAGASDLGSRFDIDLGEGSASLVDRRETADGRGWRGGHAPELELDLPRGATIVVETVSADLEVDSLHGEQRYQTTSGDITLRDVRGRLTIEAVSADLDIRASGTADVSARTVSGDIELRALTLRSLDLSTTSGDVQVAGRLDGPGPFAVETVSGDAQLAPAGDVRIEMATMSGDLHSEVGRQTEGGRGHRTLVVGSGGPQVTFRSMSGDLNVVRPVPVLERAVQDAPIPAQCPRRRPCPRLHRPRSTRPNRRGTARSPRRTTRRASGSCARSSAARSTSPRPDAGSRRSTAASPPDRSRPRRPTRATRRRRRPVCRSRTRTMPDEALEGVLRLLAEGRLTAEEAGPIIDALDDRSAPRRDGSESSSTEPPRPRRAADPVGDDRGRILRVEVTEKARSVINLRIPLSLGRAAISQVPGISEATSDRIREAIEAGVKGSILEVDDAGDGVRISIE